MSPHTVVEDLWYAFLSKNVRSNQVLDHLFSYLLQQVLANDVVIVRRQDHCW